MNTMDVLTQSALEDIRTSLRKEGLYLLCGPSGSGKTTLAKNLFHLLSGESSMLLQENDLIFHNLSVLENIDLNQGKSNEINNILAMYQLEFLTKKTSAGLSGGERRIVSVIRTLVSSRHILIMDEPTNDMDYFSFNTVKQLLHEYARHKSILVITHDDRLNEFTKKFQFEGGLINTYNGAMECSDTNWIKENLSLNPFYKKWRKKNPVFYICLFLMMIVFYASINDAVSATRDEPYTEYPKGVYRVASMLTMNTDNYQQKDAANTALLRVGFTPSKYSELLIDKKKQAIKMGESLSFVEGSVEHVYPLEYYNGKTKIYTDVKDSMANIVAEILQMPETEIELNSDIVDLLARKTTNLNIAIPKNYLTRDAKEYFESMGYAVTQSHEGNATIDFSWGLYKEAINRIPMKGQIITEAIAVKPKSVSFVDFIGTNHFSDKAYFIKGYEVYYFILEALEQAKWYSMVWGLTIYFIAILGFLWVITQIFERANSYRYRILFYYGFPIKTLYQEQIMEYCLKTFMATTVFAAGLLSLYLIQFYQRYYIILVFFLFVVTFQIAIKIVRRGMQKVIRKALT